MTATFGINDQVNETLGITVELEISSEAVDFINQILSFLAYDGSSSNLFSHVADG
jgi:uncharacterized membrane protein